METAKSRAAALAALLAAAAACAGAVTVVDVEGTGAEKILVAVETEGDPAFAQCLKRNLSLSGAFRLARGPAASLKVSGRTGGAIVAEGRGKRLSLTSQAKDAKAARQEARMLADRMCETYAGQKGFAQDRIVFVCKKGRAEELCTGYADGADIRQITQDGRASVGPRWKDARTVFYTGYLNNAPQIFEIDADTGRKRLLWGFGGLTTGAAMAPGGGRAAIILSKPFGNPELCTIDLARGAWSRITTTRTANEGQPAWSPDGAKIAYVSDETRRQHIFVADPATKAKRRLTSSGSQNVDPDWGPDGRIAYTTKRGGLAQIAVMKPSEGDASARLLTEPGSWEHPSWARDGRHLVAERDGALFLIDAAPDGDPPAKLFSVAGRCITPSWRR